ncbi:MAG: FAD:protein transferase [Candidatus Doudnabacteria bacterium]|nr:FAD:protein transferase [Candidatus Doudnabacteria bacterium]
MPMKDIRIIMGMPITIEVLDQTDIGLLEKVFNYFISIDQKFSTYKDTSEVSLINQGKTSVEHYSAEMREVLELSEQTKQQTEGYFDVYTPDHKLDPSGLVKGWAILNAAKLLESHGSKNYYIDAGGDIQVQRPNRKAEAWQVGIQNPFDKKEIVKVLQLHNQGLATSGSYTRGAHIYNPKDSDVKLNEVVSITVIGPNVYEADRFATAAFAMGNDGIYFIEKIAGLEGYQINKDRIATETTGFKKYYV